MIVVNLAAFVILVTMMIAFAGSAILCFVCTFLIPPNLNLYTATLCCASISYLAHKWLQWFVLPGLL